MTAYALFDNLSVEDEAGLAEYRSRVKAVVEKYGGRYVVVGGDWETLEGQRSLTFPVLIEFPDAEAARSWYHSDDYRPLRDLRQRSANVEAVLMATDDPTALLDG